MWTEHRSFLSPYSRPVWPYRYITLPYYSNVIVQKHFSPPPSQQKSSACSTAAEPTDFTERGTIGKGSIQCIAVAVGFFSRLLFTVRYSQSSFTWK